MKPVPPSACVFPAKFVNLCSVRSEEADQIICNSSASVIKQLPADDVWRGAVILLVDEMRDNHQLMEQINDVVNAGNRVLIVDLEEGILPYYKTMEWLGLGVEDIWSRRHLDEFIPMLQAHLQRWGAIEGVFRTELDHYGIVGNSRAWQQVLHQVIEIAVFSDSGILIQGESGTGKELIARLIHGLDQRPGKEELVLLDCSTIQAELSGSEFFGHEKGAFTHAISTRDGAFALADKGTLFLDEIGELPLPLQAELLRVIQEKTYKRLGSNVWRRTEFRLICATNRDLDGEVRAGRFRHDLYHRIKASCCVLPPLRDRREDIGVLANYFLCDILKTRKPPQIDRHLMNHLLAQPYPGNIRELRQLIQRVALRYSGQGPLTLGCLFQIDRLAPPSSSNWYAEALRAAIRLALSNGIGLKDIKRKTGEVAMELAMEDTGGNLQAAARELGVTDRVLQLFLAERSEKSKVA